MVVGSTGLIGRSLVHQLIEGGEPVKALTERRSGNLKFYPGVYKSQF